MKKLLIPIISFLTVLSVMVALPVHADNFSVAAKSAIAVDASSGKILYVQNATDASTPIASVTKLLTAYLVYKSVDDGKITWNTKVPISNYAYELTQNADASNIPLAQGETFTVKELMNALLIPSANSAAVALSEKIGGSEPKFVDMMQAQLKQWGVTDAKLVNASGLPNDDLDGHIYPGSAATATNTMSAEDVAIVSYHLLKDYPQVLDITKQTSLPFDQGGESSGTLTNTNQMLKGFSTSRSGVDGLKTGSTGFQIDCFAGTTTQNGFRIITVVLDATNPAADNSTPFTLTNQLMNYVYGSWTTDTIANKNKTFKNFKKFSITDGKSKSVPLVAAKNITPVVPLASNGTPDTKHISINFSQKKTAAIEAPIKKSQPLVNVYVKVKDKLGYLPQSTTSKFSLIAKTSIQKSIPPVVWWNHFVKFVNNDL
ncbi:serine hydrolase [Lactococcus nasutitermitis]|uniref:serine-type D-Ala-D-Ala carboxypeptidase n=1 Tax=Lactococcus nasutitermitis TaxID=1652957 RepID=A0ABV9JES4_9LACT|nr:serine hydrolase [Lactococcus nasutitermitis]